MCPFKAKMAHLRESIVHSHKNSVCDALSGRYQMTRCINLTLAFIAKLILILFPQISDNDNLIISI